MNFKTAVIDELPAIENLYKSVVAQMFRDGLNVWDEVYPVCALPQDISAGNLFTLSDDESPIAAFTLSQKHGGSKAVNWAKPSARAVYVDRFCVAPEYRGTGTGKLMLEKACELASSSGAEYLRLFVVDRNSPAISLYIKNGFVPAKGEYIEDIAPGLALRQFALEKKL